MKKLFLWLPLILLAGCASAPPPVIPVAVKFPAVSFQNPQPIVMRPVTWKVYTKANIAKLQTDFDTNGGTIIAVSAQGYKNLSSNLLEAQRYIREQKAVNLYLVKEINQRSQ